MPFSYAGYSDLEIVNPYTITKDQEGNSGVTGEFVTDTLTSTGDDNAGFWRNYLFGVTALEDTSLVCSRVVQSFLGDDAATGKVKLKATFIPWFKFIALMPNSPLRVRIEWGNEFYTTGPSATAALAASRFQWRGESGTAIARDLFAGASTYPAVKIQNRTLVFFGTRTAPNYTPWENMISSDAFYVPLLGETAGAPPYGVECSSFDGATAKERLLPTGVLTFDIEVRVKQRAISFNKFWAVDTGKWEYIRRADTGDYMFGTTTFIGLDTA